MKEAVILILIMGIALGFWLMYEVVKHYQGDKIKAYLKRQRDIHRAEKHYNKIQEENKLKAYERSLPELVEVEDLGNTTPWQYVKDGKRQDEPIIIHITTPGALTRT